MNEGKKERVGSGRNTCMNEGKKECPDRGKRKCMERGRKTCKDEVQEGMCGQRKEGV